MRCFVALNHVEGTLGELSFSGGLLAVLGDIVTRWAVVVDLVVLFEGSVAE